MTFGERLRTFRQLAGLSQRELAEKAAISHPTLSLVERGKQASVMIDVGQRLAQALGITFAQLVGTDSPGTRDEGYRYSSREEACH